MNLESFSFHPKTVREGSGHTLGPEAAVLRLVEYGDYECMHTARANRTVKEIMRKLDGRLSFTYRHFPLREKHSYAQPAAEAAEAAAEQGRFWEMHDLLFEHQDELNRQAYLSHAKRLGLDIPVFVRALDQHLYLPRVRTQFIRGLRSGVESTPSFFLNGKPLGGAEDLSFYLHALDDDGAQAA